jgi:plasmid stability protein
MPSLPIEDMPRNQPLTTTLTIRNVSSTAKERLRVRPALHGRSMEAELRAILSATLDGDTEHSANLAEAIRRRFAPIGGVELDDHPMEFVGDPPDFTS